MQLLALGAGSLLPKNLLAEETLHCRQHSVRVRTRPIHLLTVGAVSKSALPFADFVRHLLGDLRLTCRAQFCVAHQAAGEKPSWSLDFETLHNLSQLFKRVIAAQQQDIADPPFVRQPAIECKDLPLFYDGPADKVGVFDRVFLGGVEAEHPQPPDEAVHHHVGEEL